MPEVKNASIYFKSKEILIKMMLNVIYTNFNFPFKYLKWWVTG